MLCTRDGTQHGMWHSLELHSMAIMMVHHLLWFGTSCLDPLACGHIAMGQLQQCLAEYCELQLTIGWYIAFSDLSRPACNWGIPLDWTVATYRYVDHR